jgi:hypothetical protein
VSMSWAQPVAWWGLVALAIPIAIHLLARHQSRRLAFPSLRFLHATRVAALRRRRISEWPLLLLRLLTVGIAVSALAGPTLVTQGRRGVWATRVSRSIVTLSAASAPSVEARDRERASAFRSEAFAADNAPRAALRAALAWHAAQPPSTHEIVVVGSLRRGELRQDDIDAIPPHIGVRFVHAPTPASDPPMDVMAVADNGDGTRTHVIRVTADDERTRAVYEEGIRDVAPPLQVRAASEDQPFADAALRTVAADGVVWSLRTPRATTIVFVGAEGGETDGAPPTTAWMRQALERLPGVRGVERDGRLVVFVNRRASQPDTAAIVARVAHAVLDETSVPREPSLEPAASLDRWTRPPTGLPEIFTPGDEGDRRWLWGVALGLLGVEQLWRRKVERDRVREPLARPESRVA